MKTVVALVLLLAPHPVSDSTGHFVVVTSYTSRTCETDSTPHQTASMTRTRPGIIALSRDLLREYTPNAPYGFGDRVLLYGLGEYRVEDTMAARHRNRADIWMPSVQKARGFGRRETFVRTLEK